MDPEQLIETGFKHDNENWIALGHFAEMYLDNLDASETTDYGELVHRVNLLLIRLKSLEEIGIKYENGAAFKTPLSSVTIHAIGLGITVPDIILYLFKSFISL
jgi:hypothetical protein